MSAIDNARAALDSLVGDFTHSASEHEMRLADALRDLIAEHERVLAEREWEYMSVMVDDNTGDDWDEVLADSREEAQRNIDAWIAENGAPEAGISLIIRRRIKPGPWLTDQADRSTT